MVIVVILDLATAPIGNLRTGITAHEWTLQGDAIARLDIAPFANRAVECDEKGPRSALDTLGYIGKGPQLLSYAMGSALGRRNFRAPIRCQRLAV